jgi:hypothetical protein
MIPCMYLFLYVVLYCNYCILHIRLYFTYICHILMTLLTICALGVSYTRPCQSRKKAEVTVLVLYPAVNLQPYFIRELCMCPGCLNPLYRTYLIYGIATYGSMIFGPPYIIFVTLHYYRIIAFLAIIWYDSSPDPNE